MNWNQTLFRRLLLVFALFSFFPLALQAQEEPAHKPSAQRYRNATECAKCHAAIYRVWAHSMHALAVTDPNFQAALRRTEEQYGPDSRRFCLSCHAPTTQVTGDLNLENPVTREGVTCDFCHTVTSVREAQPQNVFEVQLGDTKFGPNADVEPISGLQFRYSALHGSALLCAGCHELSSPAGTPVLTTYSEWKKSPYAERGIQCQNCHMPETRDVPSVDASVRAKSPAAHAHEFLGGHSQIRLENAATLTMSCLEEAGKIRVDAFVTNEEAGHALPTGIPIRKVTLTVSIKDPDGTLIDSRTREYMKIVEDRNGKILTEAEQVMMEAVKVKNDNRILPKETRHEVFEFTGYPIADAYIVAADLKYSFQTGAADASAVTLPMTGVQKTLRPEVPEGPVRWIFLILISAVLLVVLFLIITSVPKPKRGR